MSFRLLVTRSFATFARDLATALLNGWTIADRRDRTVLLTRKNSVWIMRYER